VRALSGRLAAKIVPTVFAVLLVAGCGGSAGGPRGVDASASGGPAVALARSMLGNEPIPEPGPFQQALLDKGELTYADYESAMQAMAQCIEDQLPGTVVYLTPGRFQPQTLDFALSAIGDPPPSAVVETPPLPSGATTASSGDSGGAAAAITTSAPPAGGNPSGTSAGIPTSMVESMLIEGQCMATYSARVADKWTDQLVLAPDQAAAQKPQFLQCMAAAGVVLPKDTSDANLKKMLQTPDWGQDQLSPQQSDQANQCLVQYSEFVNTIAR
jgi:hypothetical protein